LPQTAKTEGEEAAEETVFSHRHFLHVLITEFRRRLNINNIKIAVKPMSRKKRYFGSVPPPVIEL
jgi:hypothetical protein